MAVSMTNVSDRIAGSLYGLLLGDAFGCPVEGWSAWKITEVYRGALEEMVEPSERWRPRGLHSDDGQQAMALCQAILSHPDQPEIEFARLLVEMLRAGPVRKGSFGLHRGTGRNFRRTVQVLAEGGDMASAAQPSAGNGTAMLIAPAAWYWRDDRQTLIDRVVRIASIKQSDIRGIAAAGAVAYVTAFALNAESFAQFRPGELLEFVKEVEAASAQRWVSNAQLHTFSAALEAAVSDPGVARNEALEKITARANQREDRMCTPGSGYVLASVITSIYMTLTSTSFEQAVADTVNLGGDTDTTGAIVGAMCGAMYGKRGLPDRWFHRLEARDAFNDWIEPIVKTASGWTPARSIVELESGWSRLARRG